MSKRERAQFYRDQVATIFETNCVECHGVEETEAGLDLRTFRRILRGGASGSVIVWDQPDESLLLSMVADGEMPPDGDGLEANDIETLRRWIAVQD